MENLVKALRQQFPYTPPGDLYPSKEPHEFMWNIALREGREQVIRWLESQTGGSAPSPDIPDDHVYSAEDRPSPSADACARRRTSG